MKPENNSLFKIKWWEAVLWIIGLAIGFGILFLTAIAIEIYFS